MRLLDVHNFTLESNIPDRGLENTEAKLWSQTSSVIHPYAILSHRWIDGEEITFDNLSGVSKDRFRNAASPNPVYQYSDTRNPINREIDASSVYKIAGACQQVRNASKENFRHIWIDTVCINKSDAQELNIAINSMFRWYESAEVCFVYLFDVSWTSGDDSKSREQFLKSQWFKRGW